MGNDDSIRHHFSINRGQNTPFCPLFFCLKVSFNTSANSLAVEIINYSKSLLSNGEKIRFLDPAIGTGAFNSALLKLCSPDCIENAIGYEIDVECAKVRSQLWSNTPLQLTIADFTEVSPPEKIITNSIF